MAIPRAGSSPRRVLFLHSSAGRYGADRQLLLLARSLDPGRYRTFAVLPFEGPLAEDLRGTGAEVYTAPLAVLRREHMHPLGLVRVAREVSAQERDLVRLVEAHRIDLLHANTSVILGGARVASRTGIPLVVHVREIYPRVPLLWAAHRRRILGATALLCVSEAVRDQFGGDPRARVVHDGLAVLPQRAPQAAARLVLGLPRDAFVVAVLGRISSWKGQDVLARALATPTLRERGAIGLVAGDAWPGQQGRERELHRLAVELGLGDRLRLVGFRDDVENVYGAADVVAVPSTRPDPLPNAALEAAAAGCCLVAAAHGGLPEIVRDGSTGVLVRPRDPLALAAALAALAENPATRERLATAAAADARSRFPPERLAERVAEVYDELLP